MLIKIILIASLVFVLVQFLSKSAYRVRAITKITMLLFTILAIFFVIFLDSSNRVARFVGVSRGADLLLYLLTVVVLFFMLQTYVKEKRSSRREVIMARKIAIMEARQRYSELSKKQS